MLSKEKVIEESGSEKVFKAFLYELDNKLNQ
jgi:hypothetical protein